MIEINDRRKLFAIKESFSSGFPSLKLEFYGKPNTGNGPHSDKLISNSGLSVGDCRAVNHNGTLIITPGMTPGNLKDNLRDLYGLKAEVYKRIGDGPEWIPAENDRMSLEELDRADAQTV